MDPAVDPEAEAGHAPSQEGAPQTGVTSVTVADAAGASQTGQASSQSSSFLSGPSCAAGDEEQMDSSVCRKRKDRPLAELSCSISCEELISSSKKVFKSPAAVSGRHSRLPTAVREHPAIKERPSPIRPSTLPVRARERSSKR